MSELPNGWVETLISELAKIVSGATPKSKVESNFAVPGKGIAWLTPADLSGYKDKTIKHGARDLSEDGYASCSAKLMPKGSVLFSSRAPVGYVVIADNEICTNQGFKSFVFKRGVDSSYAYYYLRWAKPIAEELATGTTFKELSGSNAAKIPFLLPPLNEQKRIAAKLDRLLARVDAAKARLDKIPNLLKRLRQAILAAATSGKLTEAWRDENPESVTADSIADAVKAAHVEAGGHKTGNAAAPSHGVHDLTEEQLPAGWRLVELRDVVAPERPICYGILMPGPELSDGVPYVRVADFPDDKLNLNTVRKTSPEIDASFKRSRLNEGDILLSIRGTVGRLIVVPAELQDANITQDSARLSVQVAVNRDYVLWFLRSETAQSRMGRAVKGVAVRGINIGDVRALQVPLPSQEEQNEIVRRVEELFAIAARIEAQYRTARARVDRLSQSLLAKAFRGELVPQDPNDEPAAVLLERIRAERAAAPKPQRGRRKKPTEAELPMVAEPKRPYRKRKA